MDDRPSPSEPDEYAELLLKRSRRRREVDRLRRAGRPVGRPHADEWAPLRGAPTWKQALNNQRFDDD